MYRSYAGPNSERSSSSGWGKEPVIAMRTPSRISLPNLHLVSFLIRGFLYLYSGPHLRSLFCCLLHLSLPLGLLVPYHPLELQLVIPPIRMSTVGNSHVLGLKLLDFPL